MILDRARGAATTSPAEPHHSPAGAAPTEIAVRLFDADRTDAALELDEALDRRLGDRQLLWIDASGPIEEDTLRAIAARMDLKHRTRHDLQGFARNPHIALHGPYFHIRIATEADHDPGQGARWLDLVAAGNVVLTTHAEPVPFLRELDERIEADAMVGAITGAAFVAAAIDAAVTTYFKAVDAIEDAVDRIDGRALMPLGRGDVLSDLVALRRRIARLRRVLSDQRGVFAAFATPDFAAITSGDDAAAFQAVAGRFESALRGVEASRDLLLGSFDVFMTRTAQRTNEVMKVLALATVLLLPGSLIAGLLGMNVVVPLSKDDPAAFWYVVGTIVVLTAGVLALARFRRWI